MMSKKKIVFVLMSSLVLFFMASPLAEAKEKKFHFGFSFGVTKWPSGVFKYMRVLPDEFFVNLYRGMNILDEEINLKAVYNLSLQYDFSPHFGIQAEIGHQKANYKVIFYLIPKSPEAKGVYQPQHVLSWSVSTIFINAIFRGRKPEKRIIPFAFAGAGLCFVQGEEKEFYEKHYKIEIRSAGDLALKAGGGFTFNLPEILPLGFNIRAFLQVLGAQAYGYYYPSGGNITEVGGYNIIWGIDMGLRYRF